MVKNRFFLINRNLLQKSLNLNANFFNFSKVVPEGVPDFIVFKSGKKIESLMSDNPYKVKALIDKYNIDKKEISKVLSLDNSEQFNKGIFKTILIELHFVNSTLRQIH